MLCYGMLYYPMLWYGMESMVCYKISMLCYEISMLCYAMVYVVKDKHSATVYLFTHTNTHFFPSWSKDNANKIYNLSILQNFYVFVF